MKVNDIELLKRYIRGLQKAIYTVAEWYGNLPSMITAENVSSLVSLLPENILANVVKHVEIAPRTEEEWKQCVSIEGAIFRLAPECKTQEQVEEWHRQRRAIEQQKYRRGIEALRRHFRTSGE
jgi:hypothetical protein